MPRAVSSSEHQEAADRRKLGTGLALGFAGLAFALLFYLRLFYGVQGGPVRFRFSFHVLFFPLPLSTPCVFSCSPRSLSSGRAGSSCFWTLSAAVSSFPRVDGQKPWGYYSSCFSAW